MRSDLDEFAIKIKIQTDKQKIGQIDIDKSINTCPDINKYFQCHLCWHQSSCDLYLFVKKTFICLCLRFFWVKKYLIDSFRTIATYTYLTAYLAL